MGLTSGGLSEEVGSHKYEMGVLSVGDDSAKLGNWWASDFEKILHEAKILNPAGGVANALPCEALHEVSQNPRIASSIGATQHTQISRGGTMLWPVLRLEARPMLLAKLGVYLDVVQVMLERADCAVADGRQGGGCVPRDLQWAAGGCMRRSHRRRAAGTAPSRVRECAHPAALQPPSRDHPQAAIDCQCHHVTT
eukprot:6957999-Prymnesium_polylepis.1